MAGSTTGSRPRFNFSVGTVDVVMVSADEILDAAISAPAPHKDIVVPLRSDNGERAQLARDREELEQRMRDAEAAATDDQRLSSPAPELESFKDEFAALQERENELDARDAGHLVTIRVWQIPGIEWVALTAQHSNAFGGYDLNTVCREAAMRNGAFVIDGAEHPIAAEQWGKLWGILSGRSVDEIAAAVYELNVGDTVAEVERLGKVSRPTPATSSD